MQRKSSMVLFLAILITFATTLASGCTNIGEDKGPVIATNDTGKISATTSSEDAKKEFLAGRDLAEKLLIQDSIQHFDKAISLDPNFAAAELGRANSSPTAREFFDHLKKAVGLADKVSQG